MDKIVEKPWGYYEDHLRTDRCVQKTLVLLPGQAISMQYHKHRTELWFIDQGVGQLTGEVVRSMVAGDHLLIPTGSLHKLTNTSETERMVVREMQFGELCNEEDIVRLD